MLKHTNYQIIIKHFSKFKKLYSKTIFPYIIYSREQPTESEHEFRRQLWAMRNPSKPLPKSDEAKWIVQENKREEQISAERKMLL